MFLFKRDYKKVYGSIASSALGACANSIYYVLDYKEYSSTEAAVQYLEKNGFNREEAVNYLLCLDVK